MAALAAAGVGLGAAGFYLGRENLGIGGLVAVICSIAFCVVYFTSPPMWLECERIEEGRLWLKPLGDDALAALTAAAVTSGPRERES